MPSPSFDLSTVLAIWCLAAVTGVGVAALPWTAVEVSESALAWRALGSLLARGAEVIRSLLRTAAGRRSVPVRNGLGTLAVGYGPDERVRALGACR